MAYKKGSQGGMVSSMDVCRYCDSVGFGIASIHWHHWW